MKTWSARHAGDGCHAVLGRSGHRRGQVQALPSAGREIGYARCSPPVFPNRARCRTGAQLACSRPSSRPSSEMYCFPLTLYLLSGWLTEHVPSINWSSHDAGLLQEMLFGWKVNQRFRNGFRRGTSHLHEQDIRIVADFEHGESPPPNRQRGGVRLFPSSVFNG